MISSLDLTNTEIYNYKTNLTLNISGTIYYDSIDFFDTSIQLINLRTSETSLEKLSFNITSRNKTYQKSDLPAITDSTVDYEKKTLKISSNVAENITVNAITSLATRSCSEIVAYDKAYSCSFDSNTNNAGYNLTITNNQIVTINGNLTIKRIVIQSGSKLIRNGKIILQ